MRPNRLPPKPTNYIWVAVGEIADRKYQWYEMLTRPIGPVIECHGAYDWVDEDDGQYTSRELALTEYIRRDREQSRKLEIGHYKVYASQVRQLDNSILITTPDGRIEIDILPPSAEPPPPKKTAPAPRRRPPKPARAKSKPRSR